MSAKRDHNSQTNINAADSTSFKAYWGVCDAKTARLTDQPINANLQFPCSPSLVQALIRQYGDSMIIHEHFDVYNDDLDMKLLSNKYWLRFRDQQNYSLHYATKRGLEESITNGWSWFIEEKKERDILYFVRKIIDHDRLIDTRTVSANKEIEDFASLPFAFIPFIRYEFTTPYGKIYVDESKILDDYYYVIGTIKIHTEEQRKSALLFLEEQGIDTGPVRSKVAEWLFVRDRPLYDKLVVLGIVKDVEYNDIGHYDAPPIGRDNAWFTNYAAVLRERDYTTPY